MTTINEALTPLANGFRNLYGTTDKYSADDMTKLLSNASIHNYLDDGQKLIAGTDSDMVRLTGITKDIWNASLVGKSVTLSFNAKWSEFKKDSNYRNRFGFEYCVQNIDNSYHYYGVWIWPNSESGNQLVTTTWKINDQSITNINSGYLYNQINPNSHIEITNPKIVINPLGGGNAG